MSVPITIVTFVKTKEDKAVRYLSTYKGRPDKNQRCNECRAMMAFNQ